MIIEIQNTREEGLNHVCCNRYGVIFAAALLLVLMPGEAFAVKVYSPIVKQGEVEIEYQMDYNLDGNPAVNKSSKQQFEIGYGITERWKSALNAVYLNQPTGGFVYDRLKWENIYQLFEKGERWLDAGIYFEYQIPDARQNAPDVAEVKALLQKSFASSGYLPSMRHTLNLTVKKELGFLATQPTALSYAWQSRWKYSEAFRPGFEAYGKMGPVGNLNSPKLQSHQLGPVISGEFNHMFEYQLGYLFGLTQSSVTGMLKMVIELKF